MFIPDGRSAVPILSRPGLFVFSDHTRAGIEGVGRGDRGRCGGGSRRPLIVLISQARLGGGPALGWLRMLLPGRFRKPEAPGQLLNSKTGFLSLVSYMTCFKRRLPRPMHLICIQDRSSSSRASCQGCVHTPSTGAGGGTPVGPQSVPLGPHSVPSPFEAWSTKEQVVLSCSTTLLASG